MDNYNLLDGYKEGILEYLATVGLMSEDTKINRVLYPNFVKMIYIILKNEHDNLFYNECLHFIDCVANNLLRVKIYSQDYKPEPTGKIFKKLYSRLEYAVNLEVPEELNLITDTELMSKTLGYIKKKRNENQRL